MIIVNNKLINYIVRLPFQNSRGTKQISQYCVIALNLKAVINHCIQNQKLIASEAQFNREWSCSRVFAVNSKKLLNNEKEKKRPTQSTVSV